MSLISQFFPSGESSGSGDSGYINAKVLVVGGGAGGNIIIRCCAAPPTSPAQGSGGCCTSYGSVGGVIYADGIFSPGATCPIQVGTGATSTTPVICDWCTGLPVAKCYYRFQDGGPGQASYFGGTGGLCAGGGVNDWTPDPTNPCPNAGDLTVGRGQVSIGCGGIKNIDKFESGFSCQSSANIRVQTCITVDNQMFYLSHGQAANNNVIDTNFESNVDITIPAVSNQCSSVWFRNHGFYHELLGPGNGQVVGGGQLTSACCKCGPSPQSICSFCQPILCPTVTDARKNFGGAGDGSGQGGEIFAGIGGCPGSVIVQYPNDYAATPAPNRPGSVDCSPNTPGFYTYYYLTPGSITLP